jgi:polysaccharide export outer membrane protein
MFQPKLKNSLFLVCLLLIYFSGISNQVFNFQDYNKTKDYLIGVNDVISVKVFDNSDLSGEFKVLSDGSITYPLLGKVNISGLSTLESQKLIQDLLGKDYLYDPIVSVEVKSFKSQAVYILGNVKQSGVHYLQKPTRLFDLLSEANVLSNDIGTLTGGSHVKIIRQLPDSDDADTTFIISLNQFLNEGNESINILMQNQDVVYIPNTKMIHVVGEVKKPGSFDFEEGMTVLKAISLAGGRTNASSQKNVIVKRIVNNKETKIKVKMSDLLQPDDIIEIPLSVW